MKSHSDEFHSAATALATDGWCVLPDLLTPAQTQALADECRTMHAARQLTSARVGAARTATPLRGDRTMLDALVPASQALSRTGSLQAAAAAAEAGAQATAAMAPRVGRASYLGDRAMGFPDAGAVAVTVWLRALAERFG